MAKLLQKAEFVGDRPILHNFPFGETHDANLGPRYSLSSWGNLARAAISDLLATPGDDFKAAAERVLRKNEELYRRLA